MILMAEGIMNYEKKSITRSSQQRSHFIIALVIATVLVNTLSE